MRKDLILINSNSVLNKNSLIITDFNCLYIGHGNGTEQRIFVKCRKGIGLCQELIVYTSTMATQL